jgi:hypothetical protein
MTDQEKEAYLAKNGWQKVNIMHWIHKGCGFRCSLDMAVLVQKKREKEENK